MRKTYSKPHIRLIDYVLVTSIIISVLTGCAPVKPLTDSGSKVLEDAHDYFELLEGVPNVEMLYREDYDLAHSQLLRAESLAKKGLKKEDEMILAATDSMDASRRIWHKFAAKIEKETERVKKVVEEKIIDDPDSPFNDILIQVNEIADVSRKIATQQEHFRLEDVEKIAFALDFLEEKEDSVNGAMAQTLHNDDVKFKAGGAELPEEAKTQLHTKFLPQFLAKTAPLIEKYAKSSRQFVIVIKTVGYTDLQGFTLSTKQRLLDQRKEDMPEPQSDTDFNKLLSLLRAYGINEFLQEIIAERFKERALKIRFDSQPVGKGTEIPPNLVAPYDKRDDPRRRICKVFIYVQID